MHEEAFIHFGVNTFDGREWGTGAEHPNIFQPTGLNTDQWALSLKDAGFKEAILTAKHYDGFLHEPQRRQAPKTISLLCTNAGGVTVSIHRRSSVERTRRVG